MKTRKVPLRKCTGCQEMKNKKELIRIVKTEDNFEIDKTGKKNGRGAYICDNTECLEKSFKNKGLERSFKCRVDKEIYEKLKKEVKVPIRELENE
ncbi:MAG: RNase P modulator RnpM [Lachnospirales bacterium]